MALMSDAATASPPATTLGYSRFVSRDRTIEPEGPGGDLQSVQRVESSVKRGTPAWLDERLAEWQISRVLFHLAPCPAT